jgi:formylglycine-generating enzyme required for sulfatase activity
MNYIIKGKLITLIFFSFILTAGNFAFADAELEALKKQLEQLKAKRLAQQDEHTQNTQNALAGEFVSIPGGTFQMGSNYGEEWEKPVHNVTIASFEIGKHEVTFDQWDFCVADDGCNGYWPDDEGRSRGQHPVINVSWDDVQSYILWLNQKTVGNYRLPSEAEWEYATRAGSTTNYHFGNSESELCRYGNVLDETALIEFFEAPLDYEFAPCDDGADYATPVGQYQANPYGLHDVIGNVVEWVADCAHENYSGAPTDGQAWTSGGDCSYRVSRGASWGNTLPFNRSANRFRDDRTVRDYIIGFRLARDL